MTVYTSIADMTGGKPVALTNVASSTFATKNTLITSRLATTSPEVGLVMNGGSKFQSLTLINKVDTSQYNHSSDNYDEKGPVGKLGTKRYNVLRQDLNWGWAYTDLLKIVTRFNPGAHLTSVLPLFWNEVFERIAVNSMRGAAAADAALTIDVSTKTFSLDMLIDASTDFDGDLNTVVVSKKTEARLKKTNINAYVPAGKTDLSVANYAGYNIIVSKDIGDDEVFVCADGAVAFGFGATPGLIPVEYKRDSDAGNGGGGEILRVRQSGMAQVQGMSYAIDNAKPDLTVLADAATWTRTVDADQVGVRRVKFKNA